MKKLTILFLVLFLTLTCVNILSVDTVKAAKTFKFGFTVPYTDAGGKGAKEFQKVLNEVSNDQMKVKLFPAMQLGNMRAHWTGCQSGAIHVIYAPASAASTFVPELALLDLPFLFPDDYEMAWDVVDGKLTDELNKIMNKKGFELLGIAPYGYKQFTTAEKEIAGPADLDGMKMRVIPSPLLIFQYKTWGANPTPIEFSELYTALQQGVVDGEEQALSVIKTQKFHEVQDELIISDHALFTGLLTANKMWYETLSPKQKEYLQKAAAANIKRQREFVKSKRKELIEFFEEFGMNVTTLSDEARAAFVEKSLAVHEKYASNSDSHQELLDIVYEALKEQGINLE